MPEEIKSRRLDIQSQKRQIIDNLGPYHYCANEYFHRNEEEKKINKELKSKTFIFVHGDGGIGKSTIIYHYLINLKNNINYSDFTFDNIFWFSDEINPGSLTLEKVIDNIKSELNIHGSTHSDIKSEEVIIQHFKQSRNSIIVIDNFETIKDKSLIDFLFSKLPENCKIIFTSKFTLQYYIDQELINSKYQSCFGIIEIRNLSIEDTILFFNNYCNKHDWFNNFTKEEIEKAIKHIYEKLNGNIYAIETVIDKIAFFKVKNDDIISYIDEHCADLLEGKPFEILVGNAWNNLELDTQKFLIYSMISTQFKENNCIDLNYINNNILGLKINKNNDYFKSIFKNNIYECLRLNLIENSNNTFILKPLVLRFVYKESQERKYKYIFVKWINNFIKETEGLCLNDTEKMNELDNKIDSIKAMLNYCEDNQLYKEYFNISENLRFYFYTRSIWTTRFGDDECIHIKRAKAAEKIQNVEKEFEAYVFYINTASKLKRHNNIEEHLNKLKILASANNFSDDIKFRYEHSLGLYYYSKGECDEALKHWNNILEEYKTNNKIDINAAKRWQLRCKVESKIIDQKTMLSEYEKLLEEAKGDNFERGIIDCSLLLAEGYISANNNNLAKSKIDTIYNLVEKINDSQYKSKYYFLSAIIKGEPEGEDDLRKALDCCTGNDNELNEYKTYLQNHKLFSKMLKKQDDSNI